MLRLLPLACVLGLTAACVTARTAGPPTHALQPKPSGQAAHAPDVESWDAWSSDWPEAPFVRPWPERLYLSEVAALTLPDQEWLDADAAEARAGRAETNEASGIGAQIAGRARRWVGLRSLRKVTRKVPDDCSGLVRLAYERAGVPVLSGTALRGENAVSIIWRHAARQRALHRSVPVPGDLVFFRETYDRNRDRRRNDGLTHIGIVERVDDDGTVTFIHRAGAGVVRGRLNVRHPQLRSDDRGQVLNDYIRHTDPKVAHAPRLAGELWSGFASVEKLKRSADDADVARSGTGSGDGRSDGVGAGRVPEADRVGAGQRRNGGDG